MVKNLRRRHRQVWLAMAVLVPAGILFGWLAIPVQNPVKLIDEKKEALLPDIISRADNKDYLVTIRTNKEQTEWQLEWKSKTVLTTPSAVIYKIINPGAAASAQQLIGRIETRKDYVFELTPEPAGTRQLQLIVYDFIHEQIIDRINLLL